MTLRPAVIDAATGAFAAIDLSVILAPSIVLMVAADKGGLPEAHGLDLVVGSGLIGIAHAAAASLRLRRQLSGRARTADVVISTLDATVVLALASTIVLLVVLGGFSPQHAVLVNRGWPVVALWIALQLSAVALAEITRRRLMRWFAARPEPVARSTAAAAARDRGSSPRRSADPVTGRSNEPSEAARHR